MGLVEIALKLYGVGFDVVPVDVNKDLYALGAQAGGLMERTWKSC